MTADTGIRRVLVADDEARWCKFVGDVLKDLGCQVDMVLDSHRAMEAIESTDYALVVSDNNMSRKNEGISLLSWVMSGFGPKKKPKFVLHTGDDNLSTKEKVEGLNGVFRNKHEGDPPLSDFFAKLLG